MNFNVYYAANRFAIMPAIGLTACEIVTKND